MKNSYTNSTFRFGHWWTDIVGWMNEELNLFNVLFANALFPSLSLFHSKSVCWTFTNGQKDLKHSSSVTLISVQWNFCLDRRNRHLASSKMCNMTIHQTKWSVKDVSFTFIFSLKYIFPKALSNLGVGGFGANKTRPFDLSSLIVGAWATLALVSFLHNHTTNIVIVESEDWILQFRANEWFKYYKSVTVECHSSAVVLTLTFPS